MDPRYVIGFAAMTAFVIGLLLATDQWMLWRRARTEKSLCGDTPDPDNPELDLVYGNDNYNLLRGMVQNLAERAAGPGSTVEDTMAHYDHDMHRFRQGIVQAHKQLSQAAEHAALRGMACGSGLIVLAVALVLIAALRMPAPKPF